MRLYLLTTDIIFDDLLCVLLSTCLILDTVAVAPGAVFVLIIRSYDNQNQIIADNFDGWVQMTLSRSVSSVVTSLMTTKSHDKCTPDIGEMVLTTLNT